MSFAAPQVKGNQSASLKLQLQFNWELAVHPSDRPKAPPPVIFADSPEDFDPVILADSLEDFTEDV